jgi:hypothetical protein
VRPDTCGGVAAQWVDLPVLALMAGRSLEQKKSDAEVMNLRGNMMRQSPKRPTHVCDALV